MYDEIDFFAPPEVGVKEKINSEFNVSDCGKSNYFSILIFNYR